MKHTITEMDISEFEAKTRLASSHGTGGTNKSLDMIVKPLEKRVWFVVTDHCVELASVPDLVDAIDIYNRLV